MINGFQVPSSKLRALHICRCSCVPCLAFLSCSGYAQRHSISRLYCSHKNNGDMPSVKRLLKKAREHGLLIDRKIAASFLFQATMEAWAKAHRPHQLLSDGIRYFEQGTKTVWIDSTNSSLYDFCSTLSVFRNVAPLCNPIWWCRAFQRHGKGHRHSNV